MSDMELPGGPLAARPLHFFFIADCSGSMIGHKIEELNNAIRQAIPAMQDVAHTNPNAEVFVRALRFGSGASWHIADSTPVADFVWKDLKASGLTDMGRALKLIADEMKVPPMPDRALPPVLVLVTDGMPTDDFGSGLAALMSEPWGKKAVRIAIAIGDDCDLDVLRRFIGHSEMEPLVAANSTQLTQFIRWATTAVLQAASAPPSQIGGVKSTQHVPLPARPEPVDSDDVW